MFSLPILIAPGGGDQLYCDGVWKCTALQEWLALPHQVRPSIHPVMGRNGRAAYARAEHQRMLPVGICRNRPSLLVTPISTTSARNPMQTGLDSKAAQRETAPFSDEMAAQVGDFYFNHYQKHFMTPVMAELWASIPHVRAGNDVLHYCGPSLVMLWHPSGGAGSLFLLQYGNDD